MFVKEIYNVLLMIFIVYERILKDNIDLSRSQIANLIKINQENQFGIIYCFSRTECDRTGHIENKKLVNIILKIYILAQYLLAHHIHAFSPSLKDRIIYLNGNQLISSKSQNFIKKIMYFHTCFTQCEIKTDES